MNFRDKLWKESRKTTFWEPLRQVFRINLLRALADVRRADVVHAKYASLGHNDPDDPRVDSFSGVNRRRAPGEIAEGI